MPPLPDDLPDPLALLVSTLHLMTHYAKTGCPRSIPVICHQLASLERYPADRLPDFLRVVADRLRTDWKGIAFAASGGKSPAILH